MEKTEVRKRKDPTSLPERQQALLLLLKNGVKIKDAAKSLNYNINSAYNIVNKVKKYDLANNKMVSQAHKTINNLMKGKLYGDITEIKAQTSHAAAETVLSRHQPVVTVNHNQNLNVNCDISPVDLSKYRK